jgi:hypothetical protein
MVSVTDRAKDVLLEAKQSASITRPDVGLRLAPQAGGAWELFADGTKADDQVIEHEGSTVLLIGPDVSAALAGTRVDCRDAGDGRLELVLQQAHPDGGGGR